MSLAARIASAEARARILSPGLRVISIRGGLAADASGDRASYGSVHLERAPNETPGAFRARAHEGAKDSGAKVLVFGGLPSNLTTRRMT
jgi:hypothetical protein